MNIKDYIKDCSVRFVFYRDMELWYEVIGGPTKFEFPVPLKDIGGAIFFREDKAILFMRYIRKWVDIVEEAKNE